MRFSIRCCVFREVVFSCKGIQLSVWPVSKYFQYIMYMYRLSTSFLLRKKLTPPLFPLTTRELTVHKHLLLTQFSKDAQSANISDKINLLRWIIARIYFKVTAKKTSLNVRMENARFSDFHLRYSPPATFWRRRNIHSRHPF